jgi:hypothetical protein
MLVRRVFALPAVVDAGCERRNRDRLGSRDLCCRQTPGVVIETFDAEKFLADGRRIAPGGNNALSPESTKHEPFHEEFSNRRTLSFSIMKRKQKCR